jgi:hypothetical protein
MKTKNRIPGLLEYFGVRSKNYFHSRPEISYDPEDRQAYFLDQRQRAAYDGPFDDNGLPLYPVGSAPVHLPAQIMAWGLGHLELFRRDQHFENQSKFKLAADWLVAQQLPHGSWLSTVPMKKYRLEGPWRSAMVQGLGISLLTRAALVFDNERDKYLECATKALQPFHKRPADGGVTTYHEAGPFYEEYPCDPPRHVLNGFVFALWGLYDMVRIADNNEAQLLWNNGLATLKAWLPMYDLGYWSLYQLPAKPKNPATVLYHELHVKQLGVMMKIAPDPAFERHYNRWRGYLRGKTNALRTLPSKLRWLAGGN